jgi:dCMP deaminase
MTDFEMVGEFHRKFGLPVSGPAEPSVPDDDTLGFRLRFLREELAELEEASQRGDLEGFADALADLVYVAHGTAHLAGIPMDPVFREVHRANLSKERAAGASDPRSRRGHALDVVKPAGWRPPDVAGVLRSAAGRVGASDDGSSALTKWDRRYLALAAHVAGWSKDPTTKVGAVLVGRERGRVALGYNGFPPGVADDPERLADRATKHRLVQHAERNVLDNATFDACGSTLYATFFPCSECAKSVVSRGVSRVVAPPLPSNTREPWADDHRWAVLVLAEGGVAVDTSVGREGV